MTDRFNAITVVLEKDIRDDDAEFILNAIRMIKGVLSVKGNVNDGVSEYVAKERVRREFRDKLLDIIYPKNEK